MVEAGAKALPGEYQNEDKYGWLKAESQKITQVFIYKDLVMLMMLSLLINRVNQWSIDIYVAMVLGLLPGRSLSRRRRLYVHTSNQPLKPCNINCVKRSEYLSSQYKKCLVQQASEIACDLLSRVVGFYWGHILSSFFTSTCHILCPEMSIARGLS